MNDIDSMQLLQAVKNIRDKGIFIGGEKLDHPLPRIFIGAVANPFAEPVAYRYLRLAKKLLQGHNLSRRNVFLISIALENGWKK